MQNATYLNNGVVQLGIDLTHGGSIFHFSEVNTKRNLLNHADEGRFVQQSYYGEADGSKWDGKDWVWNPIQGGGWRGQKPEILSQNITSSSLEIVSVPVHWASGKLLTECQMEEKITLDGDVAHIHYTFRNTGADATDHPATEQEVPAVFVDYALKNLVYYKGDSPWTNAALTTVVPGWPNEKHTRDEHWAAYVDDSQWGIGVYSPGSPLSTNYRFNGGSSGPTGGSCSYFAPLRTFAITKGLVFEYDVYLKIGTVDEIRSRFAQIRMNGEDVDDDPNFPKGYFYIKDSNNLTVEEEEVTIGKYGMLRRTFLKEHKNSLYQSLFLTGKLNQHLLEIEKAAQERMESQMEKLLKNKPAPDKEADPMAWTAHMNALTAIAEESILTELVYS